MNSKITRSGKLGPISSYGAEATVNNICVMLFAMVCRIMHRIALRQRQVGIKRVVGRENQDHLLLPGGGVISTGLPPLSGDPSSPETASDVELSDFPKTA